MSEILWVHFVLYNFSLEEEIKQTGRTWNGFWLKKPNETVYFKLP